MKRIIIAVLLLAVIAGAAAGGLLLRDETRQIREFGELCRARGIPLTLIDAGPETKTARERSALLAAQLHAKYLRLNDLRMELFSPAEPPFPAGMVPDAAGKAD